MNREILNIVNRVLSEEISGRIKNVKHKIFETDSMKGDSCSECGSKEMYEGECMECGYGGSEMGEELHGNQGRIDKNKNDKIDKEDFKMLRSKRELDELGGMDDGHPRFGNRKLPKRMTDDEIERLLRGDDEEDNGDDFPTKPGFVEKRMKQMSHRSNRKHNDGEVGESRYVTSKGGRFDREEIPMSRQDMEIGMDNMPGFDLEDFSSYHHNNMDTDAYQSQYDNKGNDKGELGERLYGNQKRIDKNKNNKIDSEDFKLLNKGKKLKNEDEAMYELDMNESTGDKLYFAESEIVDMIETIILEEKKKSKTKPKSKTTAIKLTKSNQDKSKKENDDYIGSVVKKMKDYLKGGSKGEYSMLPKHFPKGNGELAKMDKKAYIPSDAVGEYIANFTAAALENIDYDDIHPDESWVTDNIVGSSRTGNNPDWANAVETPNNKKRNQIRKDNLLSKLKRKAYNKSPQPIVKDRSGENTDKASRLMLKLESTEDKKVITDIEKMKNLFDYGKKTQ